MMARVALLVSIFWVGLCLGFGIGLRYEHSSDGFRSLSFDWGRRK
jgi:hypothetical protein